MIQVVIANQDGEDDELLWQVKVKETVYDEAREDQWEVRKVYNLVLVKAGR